CRASRVPHLCCRGLCCSSLLIRLGHAELAFCNEVKNHLARNRCQLTGHHLAKVPLNMVLTRIPHAAMCANRPISRVETCICSQVLCSVGFGSTRFACVVELGRMQCHQLGCIELRPAFCERM